MRAMIHYVMQFGPNPWNEKRRAEGVEAWILFRVVTPEAGLERKVEPVAVFNLDSEAALFMAHVFKAGGCPQVVEIPADLAESFAVRSKDDKSRLKWPWSAL